MNSCETKANISLQDTSPESPTLEESIGVGTNRSFEEIQHTNYMKSKIEQAMSNAQKRSAFKLKKSYDDLAISTHSCGDYHKIIRKPH